MLARVFRGQRARGRACTGGWAKVGAAESHRHERKNGGRGLRNLKPQETCAKRLQATAGTEGERERQPLSARDIDMGKGTRRMLAVAAIVRFVCRGHGEA